MEKFEKYFLFGKQIDMPLISHCGYEHPIWTNYLEKHWHDGPEIIFMTEGEITWEFSKGDPVVQRGGSFHLLGPGVSHWPRHEKRTPSRIVWLVCNPINRDILKRTTLDLSMLKEIYNGIAQNSGKLYQMSNRLMETIKYFSEKAQLCLLNPNPVDIAIFRSLVCQILVEVYEQIKKPTQATEHYIISAAKSYLIKNYQRDISMTDLTEYLGYSSTWLLKLFRREVGIPPAQYLQRYRIEKAKEFLTEDRMTVTETAFQCGFSSSQYFSQVFKKYTGQTPSEFIKT